MGYDLSPAVERAREFAREAAARAGVGAVRLSDWAVGLLADDDGKPAALVARLGADPAAVRDALAAAPGVPAPPDHALFAAGRDRSLALRGDPTLTTDYVLLAVLDADPAFRDLAAGLGVAVPALEALLATGAVAPAGDPGDPGPGLVIAEPADLVDAGRVVDANLNRAREALRVVDDYCRFVLNDRVLTAEVKGMRHALAEVAAGLPAGPLLAARDTPGDVGATLSAGGEYDRRSPAEVAAVNLKRAQEALRSTEEFGKLFGPEVGRRVEAVRYRAYTLERAVVLGTASRARLSAAKLYVLLTGSQLAAGMDWTIAEAAAGGAGVFQLREKSLPDRELLARARAVRRWTREAGALFIVNDRPDIARLADADGVHLGQDDVPVASARRVVGPDALIGVSTHTLDQVRQAVLDGADYIGVGPVFPSATKAFDQLAGLDFVREAVRETSLPAFALGGIEAGNVAQVTAAGASRVAVGAAVARADDPQAVARQLRLALGAGGSI